MSAPSDEDRLARIALGQLREPGDRRLAQLASDLGAARLVQLLGEEDAEAEARLADVKAEALLGDARARGIRFVVPGDDEWPVQLDDLAATSAGGERCGAPLGLWLMGERRLDDVEASVAVVGSRAATSYGGQMAGEIAAETASAGMTVISGAAFGVDVAAHRGALSVRGGGTVAVLAGGVDVDYPVAHQPMLDWLRKSDLVISEMAPGERPTKNRFLTRNRLIAALSRGTVVVEAALRSGALSTASWGSRLNRVLMGVPGPVTSVASSGVNQLIRTGEATLVTCGSEVLELVSAAGTRLAPEARPAVRRRDELGRAQRQLLDAFDLMGEHGTEELASRARLGLMETVTALEALVRGAFVERGVHGWRLDRTGQFALDEAG